MKEFYLEFIDDCDDGVRHHYEVFRNILDVTTQRQRIRIDLTKKFGIFVSIDNWPQVAEYDSDRYHESLVHPALINQVNRDGDFKVCLLGGGDFGAVNQIIRYKNCSHIKLVDWDLEFVDIAKTHLEKIHHHSWQDARVDIETQFPDVFDFFKNHKKKYDFVFGDLTDLTSLGSGVSSFINNAKNLLAPNGIFISQASEFPSQPEQIEKFLQMINHTKELFNHIWIYKTFVPSFAYEQSFVIASDNDNYDPLSWSTEDINSWIGKLNSELSEYSGRFHHGLFALPNKLVKPISNDQHQ